MGWIYDYGEGVIENDMLALFYYRKAAEKNLPEAQFQIGLMYLYPEIEEETNYPLAIDWLKSNNLPFELQHRFCKENSTWQEGINDTGPAVH